MCRTVLSVAALVLLVGNPVVAQNVRSTAVPISALKVATTQIAQARRDALAQKDSRNPWVAAHARQMLLWYDILTADTASERHAKIRLLPVTISRSASTDGVVTEFVARGKTRVRWVVAATASPTAGSEQDSGPFDPGVVQEEQCYDTDGENIWPGPAPCATDQEVEDAAVTTAWAIGEAESGQAQLDAATAAYCAQWPCDGEHGPSAMDNCFRRGVDASLGVIGLSAGLLRTQGMLQTATGAGWRLTRLGTAGLIAGAFVAGYGVGSLINGAIECYMYAAADDEPLIAPACTAVDPRIVPVV